MRSLSSFFGRRNTKITLIFIFWLAGLLSALLILRRTSLPLMYPLRVERISIVGMIVSLILPFILSYILLNKGYFYLVLPIIFLKALGYMFCFCCISNNFGAAGWLVRLLLLFSDTIAVLLLLHSCYQYVTGNRNSLFRYFQIAILVLIICGCLDYYIISPFIMMLINY